MISGVLRAARAAVSAVPGGGLAVTAGRILASPAGRAAVVASLAFIGGWQAKAQLDEGATLRAVVAKQRIDLRAARESADAAQTVAADIATRDTRNQEIINALQLQLSQRHACALDPAAVRGLRRLE